LKTLNEREREALAVEEDKRAWEAMSREERNRTFGFDHYLSTLKGLRERAAVEEDKRAWEQMSDAEKANYQGELESYLQNRKTWRERNLAK
jgi:hypothetical protein